MVKQAAPEVYESKDRALTLRPKRQVTLPAWVCEALGIEVGDRLIATVAAGELVLRPNKQVALDALREIRKAFADSGVSEEEMQAEGRRVRDELAAERERSGDAAA
jgi:bifunctional DNA-binding transcriptional regulator/antitoxin component of YhaV-PrlF toxin-antitoxin module